MEEEGSRNPDLAVAGEGGGAGGGMAAAAAASSVVRTDPVTPVFKKRGRPRKYGPGGTLVMPLSPVPISSSAPAGDIPVAAAAAMMMKRGRGRSGGSSLHQRAVEMISFGDSVAYSGGANFTPHIITVAAGEDVTMKVISFSQQEARAICILSANGIISNVTLRQPDSSGGTLTYEGRFELLSLSGSFMPTESGGPRSRAGGMSVALASPDGRVVGGGVAGLLVAASPVQVVIGSFVLGYQVEQKTKKILLEGPTRPISEPSSGPIAAPQVNAPPSTDGR
ncbi:AT-hook motif nuclear-localized protein 1-like [Wolffia australiana]